MVGGMVQNSTNQNHYQHQQPICSSTFFFYINNKIRPTSTINIIINIRNMPNSTTRENQHQQKFLFSSTTICLTTNIVNRLQVQQQKTRSTIWGRTTFYGRGRLGPRNSNHRACWEIETPGNKHGGWTGENQVAKSSPKINLTLHSGRAPVLVLLRFRFFLKPSMRSFRILAMENLPFLSCYSMF